MERDRLKDQMQKPCRDWLEAERKEAGETKARGKWHYEKAKVVKFTLKPDRKKTGQRLCLSEHPFGTIKRAVGAAYFLLKGLRKVAGEFALFCLGFSDVCNAFFQRLCGREIPFQQKGLIYADFFFLLFINSIAGIAFSRTDHV